MLLEPKRYIFRGQESNIWRLRTSFHRTGRADLERYSVQDTQDLNKTFSALISACLQSGRPEPICRLHTSGAAPRLSTPLLDWTWSPYVAAFFALRNIRKGETGRKKVRIFKLDSVERNHLPRADKYRLSPKCLDHKPSCIRQFQSGAAAVNFRRIERRRHRESYRKCRARARQEIS